jgi:hypothetical protein
MERQVFNVEEVLTHVDVLPQQKLEQRCSE